MIPTGDRTERVTIQSRHETIGAGNQPRPAWRTVAAPLYARVRGASARNNNRTVSTELVAEFGVGFADEPVALALDRDDHRLLWHSRGGDIALEIIHVDVGKPGEVHVLCNQVTV